MSRYTQRELMGYSSSHAWCRWMLCAKTNMWWVAGLTAFSHSGYAVQDDFGTLVEVLV